MFSKKIVTVIELSDETKQALQALDNDMQVLEELTRDVIANQTKVLAALTGEITRQVPVQETEVQEPRGIQVFEDEDPSDEPTIENEETFPQLRDSPFTRRPRHEQVSWILSVLEDGRWHTPLMLARSTARDESHFRYLRRAIQGRMREMHEEGLLDRRDSKVKGAMFDYKLRKT